MCVSKNLFFRFCNTYIPVCVYRSVADLEPDLCRSGVGFIWIRIICLDPEPDPFRSLRIRIRVQNVSKNVNNTLKINNRIRSQIRIRIHFIELWNKDPDPDQIIRLHNTGLLFINCCCQFM